MRNDTLSFSDLHMSYLSLTIGIAQQVPLPELPRLWRIAQDADGHRQNCVLNHEKSVTAEGKMSGARFPTQVTIYRRLQIGQDGYLVYRIVNSTTVELMLCQRRRHCPNINPTLVGCIVFVWLWQSDDIQTLTIQTSCDSNRGLPPASMAQTAFSHMRSINNVTWPGRYLWPGTCALMKCLFSCHATSH